MRKSLILLVAPLLLGACGTENHPGVSGELSGVKSDSLLVKYFPVGNNTVAKQDTIAMQNGKFSFSLSDSVANTVVIYALPSSKSAADGSVEAFSMKSILLQLFPGESLTVEGSFDEYKVKGSSFYEELEKVEAQTRLYANKLDSVNRLFMTLIQQKVDEDSIRKIYSPVGKWMKQMAAIQSDYVRLHPDSEAGVYLSLSLPNEEFEQLLPLLNEKASHTWLAPLFRNRAEMLELKKTREEKHKNLLGQEAPAFTLKDLEGKDFSLASLKGKYVLLDFWGSWCGWCIKGMPDLKKVYEKYKTKLEIVGIDCGDTEEKWKQAVEEHQLPWINVRNAGDPDVTAMYAVSGYPTKVLIDSEGKILKIIVGEKSEFYTYLDDLLK